MAIIESYPSQADQMRGVALVVHGLNLKPSEMRYLIQHLVEAGIEVIALTLRGHGENFVPLDGAPERDARLRTFAEVTHSEWMDEVHSAYHIAQLRSQRVEKPLFFVGFSLGGLLLCQLLLAHPHARADRMLLLAPALRVRYTSRLVRWLFPFPRLGVPSLAPRRYQSSWLTTVAAYRAMFSIMTQFEAQLRAAYPGAQHNLPHSSPNPRGLDVPTLVLMRKWDELVSYHGIERLIREYNLAQWQLQTVGKGLDSKVLSNHPVFDPLAVGAAPWADMVERALAHLLESEETWAS